jgi:hypothetical protein
MTSDDEVTLAGKLRVFETGKRHPFRMTVRPAQIAFQFDEAPPHTIVLDLGEKQARLRERLPGKTTYDDVPAQKLGEELRGTGVNYLDISFAFLYWPQAQFIKEDVVSERLTWVIRVKNPDTNGPYAYLDLWIDKDAVALIRMNAFNSNGQLLKKMEVKQVQKVKRGDKKVWMLEQMAVSAFDTKTRRRKSLTYLEL